MATTIKDIASVAQVSAATVSRVLRGDTRNGFGVSEETRSRIIDVAQSMDYRANAAAHAMATGRTRLIGVAMYEVTATFLDTILAGIQGYARRNDLTLVLYTELFGMARSEAQLLGAIRSRQVDGVLLTLYQPTDKLLKTLSESAMPFVELSPELQAGKAAVHVDNAEGGRLAGEHLLSLGHRNLAMVGSIAHYSEARWKGMQDAVAAAGLKAHREMWPSDARSGNVTERLAYAQQKCEQLLRQHPEITGVVCSEDFYAVTVTKAARALGRRIPHDLSIVGYDNMYWTEYLDTPLTTVQQPKELQGSLSLQLLQELIEGGEPREIWMKPELIVRQSTGKLA